MLHHFAVVVVLFSSIVSGTLVNWDDRLIKNRARCGSYDQLSTFDSNGDIIVNCTCPGSFPSAERLSSSDLKIGFTDCRTCNWGGFIWCDTPSNGKIGVCTNGKEVTCAGLGFSVTVPVVSSCEAEGRAWLSYMGSGEPEETAYIQAQCFSCTGNGRQFLLDKRPGGDTYCLASPTSETADGLYKTQNPEECYGMNSAAYTPPPPPPPPPPADYFERSEVIDVLTECSSEYRLTTYAADGTKEFGCNPFNSLASTYYTTNTKMIVGVMDCLTCVFLDQTWCATATGDVGGVCTNRPDLLCPSSNRTLEITTRAACLAGSHTRSSNECMGDPSNRLQHTMMCRACTTRGKVYRAYIGSGNIGDCDVSAPSSTNSCSAAISTYNSCLPSSFTGC